jgi:hypothetical protein
MYDRGKIIIGLVIGIGLLLFPVYWNFGKAAKPPDPQLTPKAKAAKECIEPVAVMRTQHMKILDIWRDDVVRKGEKLYKGSNGKIYEMSLQSTCMDCHSNKSNFCDQCHNYMAVNPYCWDCHIAPKENT